MMSIIVLTLLPLWLLIASRFKLNNNFLPYYFLGYGVFIWAVQKLILKPYQIDLEWLGNYLITAVGLILFVGLPLGAAAWGIWLKINKKK